MNFDRSLLEIFAAEQAEHVQRIRSLERKLTAPQAAERVPALDEVLRRLHTLKGAARAVGLTPTEALTHQAEALVEGVRGGTLIMDPRALDALRRALDEVERILEAVREGRPPHSTKQALAEMAAILGRSPVEGGEFLPPHAEDAVAAPPPPSAEFVRVQAASIDELVRTASQLLSSASAESLAARRAGADLQHAEEALRGFLRLRRDCLVEAQRGEDGAQPSPVRECLDFVEEHLRRWERDSRDTVAAQQDRARELHQRATEVHQGAVRVRMIPAESVFGTFGPMVREIAREESKEVDFRAEGTELLADRVTLQALKDPVMHLLRNSVSHGIETPPERIAKGKSARGAVWLRLESRGDRLTVAVEDDGRGVDLAEVREQAIRAGLLTEAEAGARSQEEVIKLLFQPGFSTAKSITSISGRGMGLSVVERAVSELHGDLDVTLREDFGLRIVISTALSISTQHILLLGSGDSLFAVPTRYVQRLLRLRHSELTSVEGADVILVDSQPVPVVTLRELLGRPAEPARPADSETDRLLPVAVIVAGQQSFGIVVDRFVDDRTAVLTELGLPAHMTGPTAGGVPLEDGSVAILLNPLALVARFRGLGRRSGIAKPVAQSTKAKPLVLVVDDSITTRSLEKSILEAHGYRVRVAVDGVEALECLRVEPADLVISDVMMPRMDGFQLLEQMKKQKETAHIPVIIVTSMEQKEDQERGLSLGADAYIVKRKFDQRELLDTVRQIL